MKLADCLDEESVIIMQKMFQKMRETANAKFTDKEVRGEFFIALAVQFFLYSLTDGNDRFVVLDDDVYEKAKKEFLETLDIALVGKLEL